MLTVADYFCGAGGSSTGMHQVPGVRVVMASNHWQLAVDTHAANFPDTDHDREDITRIDPRRHPRTDIGWFSPECTNWSVAKGRKVDYDGKPVQLDLFHQDDDEPLPDEAAHRSRMLMQDVPRFAEVHRYRAVIVENVTDVLKWAHLAEWLRRMRMLGYCHRVVVLNSAFASALGPGAPQLRDRVYFVFWREHHRAPDFAKWTRPRARCARCGDVAAVYVDKRPGVARTMRYGQQYHYRCPSSACRGSAVAPYALPAAAVIDWAAPGQLIAGRLKPKTRARIAAGLATIASPLLVPVEGRDGKNPRAITEPLRAQTARAENALVIPLRNNGVAKVAAASPLLTIAAGGTHQGLLYGYDTGRLQPADRAPLPAQTTVAGDALLRNATSAAEVDACTFRMLTVDEIRAGMAFTHGYRFASASNRAKVRMLGNAVTPPAARDLMAAVAEAITGEPIERAA